MQREVLAFMKSTINDAADANFLREMLIQTAFIRAFEAKTLAFTQSNPPIVQGSVHLCAGQEIVPLGAVAALRHDDQILCTYRGHAWALASGLDPYAVMAEICQKADGINGGRGGSAYMMAPHTRFIGENSIVGASTTIACGIAMANLAAGSGRVAVVTIGDGAMNQGSVHEAMAFAAVRKLPVIFVVENNGWSELTATSDMFLLDRLAQRAKGYGIPSATINGTDPSVVRDSFALAAQRARAGEGPSLLECMVPRLWGHYNRDMEHYRSKENRAADEARDPLNLLRNRLVAASQMSDAAADALIAEQTAKVDAIATRVMASPAPDPATARDHVLSPRAEPEAEAQPLATQELSYVQAVTAALRDILESDPRAIVYGEDVGKAGGIFQATRYLQRDLGADRVFDTPIAENAILGSAVGAAIGGLKPIVEIMWADFIFVALDQLINQAANIRYITGGTTNVPMVVRTQQGVTPGSCAQHSQSIEAILTHIPGLKVALAATAGDAYAILRAAAADPDPCVVIEARSLYQVKGDVTRTTGNESVGKARVRREGSDIAIITWGVMVDPALAAAAALAKTGIEAAVLDLRWLNPLDEGLLRRVVASAGGRMLVVHEAVRTCGFGAELLVRVQEMFGDELAIQGRRLTTPDVRMPSAPGLQTALLPNAESIARLATNMVRPSSSTPVRADAA
jgi:2-oxoisovalerate dehydrogenase E1 component